jgi:hypothetical protein
MKNLVIVFFSLCSLYLGATVREVKAVQVSGTSNSSLFNWTVPANSFIQTQDMMYPSSVVPSYFHSLSSKVEVSLKVVSPNKEYNNLSPFIYELPVKIELWKMNNSGLPDKTFYTTLSISYYNPSATNINKLVSTFTADDYCKVKVSRTSFPSTNPMPLNGLNDITLEVSAKITTNCVYRVDQIYPKLTTTINSANPIPFENSKGNAVKVTYQNEFIGGASPYLNLSDPNWMFQDATDIEWSFVQYGTKLYDYISNSGFTSYPTTEFEDLTFSRVSLPSTKNYIEIPNLYQKGYLVLRSRAVSFVNGTRTTGPWYFKDNSRTTNPINSCIIPINGAHQSNLNWSSAVSFSEDGKLNEDIVYSDGLLRNRQSVVFNNQYNIPLISENYYDQEGRLAISTLPAPKLFNTQLNSFVLKSFPANTVKFYDGFTLNTNNDPYTLSDFAKVQPNACKVEPASPMSDQAGASQYYSPNNKMHILNGSTSYFENEYLYKWIPDAEKYPFIQTRYTNDGTNQPLYISGLGADLKLGSGQEIKYYYTSVNSIEELTRVFGNHVGAKEYYSKIYTEDANGQLSLTVKNAQDNVVMTCLIGNKPADLEPLHSYSTNNKTRKDTFVETKKLTKKPKSNVLLGGSTHMVETDNEIMDFTVKFDHEKTVDDYSTGICDDNLVYCADCYYDVKLNLKDNCGRDVITEKSYSNYPQNPVIDMDCNNDNPIPLPKIENNFVVSGLTKGKYSISASVTVNEEYADAYTKKYLEELEKCDEFSINTFFNQRKDLITDYDCIRTCVQCNQLKDKVKIEVSIRKKFSKLILSGVLSNSDINTMVDKEYDNLSLRCDELCSSGQMAECKVYKQRLKNDVSRGGQYWFKINSDGTIDYSSNEPNVALAILNNAQFKDASNNMYTSAQQIVNDWKPEWEEELVKYHPEYCYYEKCLATEGPTIEFNTAIIAQPTFNCDIIKNNTFIVNEKMLGTPSPSNSAYQAYVSQSNSFSFFATPNGGSIQAHSLAQWAFIMAFSSYPDFCMDPGSPKYSMTNKYSMLYFNNCLVNVNCSNCFNTYCAEDKARLWRLYVDQVVNYRRVQLYDNWSPSGNPIPLSGPAPFNMYCWPNQYISCGPGNQNDLNFKITSPNGSLFDGLISSPSCNNGAPDVVLKFSNHTFTKNQFNSKSRVFPDFKTVMQNFVTNITNMYTANNNFTDPLKDNDKIEICKDQSENWIEFIKPCVTNKIAIAPRWNTYQEMIDELRLNLEKVCRVHCLEGAYFNGTKTIDPNDPTKWVTITVGKNSGHQTTFTSSIKSFQDVIDKYTGLTSNNQDPYCSADLIESMPNYGTDGLETSEEHVEIYAPANTSCECTQVKAWKQKWQKLNNGTTFYSYMKSVDNSFDISEGQLTTLVNGCEGTQPMCRYLGDNFTMPLSFKCRKFYNCFELAYLKSEFKEKYKHIVWNSLPIKLYQDALTGYYNTQKGMNLPYRDYEKFEQECQICIEEDFVATRKKYQTVYDQAVAFYRTGGKKFPYFEQDNLRMLAKYFNDNLNPKPATPINDLKMIEILCKYYIDTKNDFPCCVLEHYSNFIVTKGTVENYPKSKYRYYQLMRVYINEQAGYKLSLNDYKAILKNCGNIDIDNQYTCCDLHIRWKEYDQLLADKATKGQSRCEFLNWILGQDKSCTAVPSLYDQEYSLCSVNTNFTTCMDKSVATGCLQAYKLLFVAYESILGSYDINWNWTNAQAQSFVNALNFANGGTVYTWEQIKNILLNKSCHPICNESSYNSIINHYFQKWKSFPGNNYGSINSVPISKIPSLIAYLGQKIENKSTNINYQDYLACGPLAGFCNPRIPNIHNSYRIFLSTYLTASEGDIINNPADLDAFFAAAASSIGGGLTKEELQLVHTQYLACTGMNKCDIIPILTNRFKAKKGITGSFIPPRFLADYQSYIQKLTFGNSLLIDVEACGTNFCTMYSSVYSKYKEFLSQSANISFVMKWNNATASAPAVNYVNAALGLSLNLEDLKIVFKDYRYKCAYENNPCTELLFYFEKFLGKEGVTSFLLLNPNKYKDLFAYLNDFYGVDESPAYWTKRLKCDNSIDLCAVYAKIFNKYVDYHISTSGFEINWSNISSSMVNTLRTTTGISDLSGETIREAFNNTECVNKFNCTLIGHYYTKFKSNHGGTIASNASNSLTALTNYFNAKFESNLTFHEWLEKWRGCTISQDIDNYIVPCSTLKQSIIHYLINTSTSNYDNVPNGNLDATALSLLNSQLPNGLSYTATDWPLLISLCDFYKPCIVLEAHITVANNAGAQNNDCNLTNFISSLPNLETDYSLTNWHHPCFDWSLFQGCQVAPPFGIGSITCDALSSEVANFIYKLEDPTLHYMSGPNVFMRGDYLEKLRDHLNTFFSVNLSLCDYNTLLETCDPCCYQDFFNKIDYEFLTLVYQQRFNQIPDRYSLSTAANPIWEDMYNNNVLYCNRGLMTKRNISTNPTVKKWWRDGNGLGGYWPGALANEYDGVLTQNRILPLPIVNDISSVSNVSINKGTSVCSDKNPCMATPPQKLKKPKCDMSDCDAFIAAYNAAVSGRVFDKNVDFNEWWDAVYWDVIDQVFGDNDYMTKEELKLKLLCCGIDIHGIPCDNAFRQKWDDFVNKFRPNNFPNHQQILDFLNGEFVLNETLAYWLTKLSVAPCNILSPDGTNDCDFFRTNFIYSIWSTGGDVNDVLDELNEDYNLTQADLIQKLRQCYTCAELYELIVKSPPFKKLMQGLCGCSTDADILNWMRTAFMCDFPGQDDCEQFKMMFSSVLGNTNGGIPHVIDGLKPAFNFTVDQLLFKLKLCYTCTEIEQLYNASNTFQNLIMSIFKVSNMADGLAALKAYFGCDGQTGGSLILPNVLPIRILENTAVNTENYRSIKTLPLEQILSHIQIRQSARQAQFEAKISQTSFRDILASNLVSDYNVYACAAPPSGGGGSGGGNGSSPAPASSFNKILGLNIDFDKYTCCGYCDKKLYDKPAVYDPKQPADPCATNLDLALSNALEERSRLIQAKAKEYKENYINKCKESAKLLVYAEVTDRKYHYTLHYYDQAGNLTMTVPPKGVHEVVPPAQPVHKLETKYWYNMDNQVIKSLEPDKFKILLPNWLNHNVSTYVYDELGRIIMSQSPKQYPNACSYSIYDKKGRVVESGEIKDNNAFIDILYQTTVGIVGANIPFNSVYSNPHKLQYCHFLRLVKYYRQPSGPGQFVHVVRTTYDHLTSFPIPAGLGQDIITENVWDRVAATTLDEVDADKNESTFTSALFYSYDMIGNVKKLYTVSNVTNLFGTNRLKTIDYDYDQPSGKVTKVFYQKGHPEQYIHKYGYDADNRLTSVHTSFDDQLWTREASYKYYLHGPLARKEVGELQVQGMDYVYNLQGWLKSMNGSSINTVSEPGQDGIDPLVNSVPVFGANPAPADHFNVARDAVAYSLDYFTNDYKSILGTNGNIGAKLSTKNLYNGNIVSSKITNSALENTTTGQSANMGYTYTYDQLHRLVAMDASKTASYTATPEFKETITYDANGNILTLQRDKDATGGTAMDQLTYKGYFFRNFQLQSFTPGPDGKPAGFNPATDILTNQMSSVSDAVATSASSLDVDNQAANNFEYDAEGNLTKDFSNGNMTIKWNPAGKVSEVFIATPYKKINYSYSPMGHRIMKRVETTNTTDYTYYARDVDGNLIHTHNGNPPSDQFPIVPKMNEYVVYGLSRIGTKFPIFCKETKVVSQIMPNNNGGGGQSMSAPPGEGGEVPPLLPPLTNEGVGHYNTTPTANPCPTSPPNYAEEVYNEPIYAQYSSSGGGIGPIIGYQRLARYVTQYSSMTRYEISNHVGNVLATVKDEPAYTTAGSGGFTRYLKLPIVIEATDYYPFGMPMPGRTLSLSSTKYRFGFNTQERENEVYGFGNLSTAEFWEYDTRLGRRWNLDPVDQIDISNYAVNGNNPIWYADPDGDVAVSLADFSCTGKLMSTAPSLGTSALTTGLKTSIQVTQSGQFTLAQMQSAQSLGLSGLGNLYASKGGGPVLLQIAIPIPPPPAYTPASGSTSGLTWENFKEDVNKLRRLRIKWISNPFGGPPIPVFYFEDTKINFNDPPPPPPALQPEKTVTLQPSVDPNEEGNEEDKFEPTNRKEINKEIKNVANGRGRPRLDRNGRQKIFRGDQKNKPGYGSQKNWVGAEEFEVQGKAGDHLRILRLRNPDGTFKFGWSNDVDYKVIHEIKMIIK